ncbi:hypothetical protein [Catellatospora citrea]|uniref:Flp pilus-assembly TadE/G-like protein n=1 Tax=Catellatospora citrea TaxID=53366 RepID=A0A8J3P0S7_9ACTN|nr:hypothetical protein [Catellatospora citrea]RKE10349.1 hypothetical protein C8E86_5244 [Catellatospora citrea]GIF99146.1 hypothetical protein Cci01nite_42400 [Catellatospora citrea]
MTRWRGDAGKATVFVAIMALGWVVMFGMVVVGGGRLRAYQRADNVAAEAARSAGQAINPAQAIQGDGRVIDGTLARAAAQAYLDDVGATGTVVVAPDGASVTVRATISYQNPSGLAFLGGATWTATGEATATLLIG